MNWENFVYVFLFLGILFALLSLYVTMRPVHKGYVFAPVGIISTAIISGVCFYVKGMLVRKHAGPVLNGQED